MATSPNAVRRGSQGQTSEDATVRNLVGGSLLDPEWMMDPKLELWVDVEEDPVVVRLAGTLDRSTSASVLAVMAELIDQGRRTFMLDTATLQLGSGGDDVLAQIEGLVLRFDGRLLTLDG